MRDLRLPCNTFPTRDYIEVSDRRDTLAVFGRSGDGQRSLVYLAPCNVRRLRNNLSAWLREHGSDTAADVERERHETCAGSVPMPPANVGVLADAERADVVAYLRKRADTAARYAESATLASLTLRSACWTRLPSWPSTSAGMSFGDWVMKKTPTPLDVAVQLVAEHAAAEVHGGAVDGVRDRARRNAALFVSLAESVKDGEHEGAATPANPDADLLRDLSERTDLSDTTREALRQIAGRLDA